MTRLHPAMLRVLALLVPGGQRAEWLAEWRAELCYVTHGATRFCLGAFRDALWLRCNSAAPDGGALRLESPVRCLLVLAVVAAGATFCVLRQPALRDLFLPSPYRDARSLAMISGAGRHEARVPTVPLERYRRLAAPGARYFSGVAFYRPQTLRLPSTTIPAAVASDNLFQLLEIPVALRGPVSLVLSDRAWRKYFGADPGVVGRTLELEGGPVVIAGVIPADSWRLPGRAEAWLLQDAAHLDRLPARTLGFVVGRKRDVAPAGLWWTLRLASAQGSVRFEVASFDRRPLLLSYLFMMPVALLMLAATTRLGLCDYPAARAPLPQTVHLRRWIFFSVKLALLLPIVCGCASLVALDLQPHGVLAASVLAFRWALLDQRRRCPVCLRLLTNPTRIGGPSRTFLEWYGTELICTHGHGLLYVPEIPSSCYGIQRWQYLDPSWSSLFS